MAASLRNRLLAWVLLPLAATVAIDAWVGHAGADETASLMQDRLLLGSARVIAEDLRFDDGVIAAEIPPAAIELFQSGGVDRVYYRVTAPHDDLLIGYVDLPAIKSGRDGGITPAFVDTTMRGEAVRMVVLTQPVVTPGATVPVVVEVAQTRRGHQRMLRGLWLRTVAPLLLVLALATALIVFGLRRGLLPLTRLRERILAREPGTAAKLVAPDAPQELRPLVDALNDVISRLDQYTRSQRLFIENAAHQLRTPLAVLSTQLAAAGRSLDEGSRAESLAAMRQTIGHAARLISQLLTMSVAESPDRDPANGWIDLDDTVRLALERAALAAQARSIDLGYASDGPARPLRADPVMVREVIANLLDNAIRYTPPSGIVTLHVHHRPDAIELRVEDNGPGIPPEWRERVFERFFRIDNTDDGGAGLGLPIVQQFVHRMGAELRLGDPDHGSGLVVTVRWPAPATPPQSATG